MSHRTPPRDPHIHHHPLAARTVVVAPRRADRPSDLTAAGAATAACPFCVGNEASTPPHVLRAPESAAVPWHARIIPNRYPIVETNPGPSAAPGTVASSPVTAGQRSGQPARPAHGIHEVVIEAAEHVRSILEVDPAAWRAVWALVCRRLAMLEGVPGIAWATVFKNSGPAAGASLEHLHSQLVGLDFVPPVVVAERAAAGMSGQSFADLIVKAEAGGCLVAEAADVVAIVPPAPRQPFETWILPRTPEPLFSATSPQRVAAVADLTRQVVALLDRLAPGADYNWWLHQAPFGEPAADGAARWHWHLEILPRLSPFAGFELGTGCHITTMGAEESARRMLRERFH